MQGGGVGGARESGEPRQRWDHTFSLLRNHLSCALSLSLSLWKMVFQSCSSLPVLQCVGGLLYTAVKPMKTLLLCETSNGAKRAMLTGVTVNSHVWVAHIL